MVLPNSKQQVQQVNHIKNKDLSMTRHSIQTLRLINNIACRTNSKLN